MRINRSISDCAAATSNGMKTNICPFCVMVSALWLILSAGMAWGYFDSADYLLPTALLMGGTVVGVAYQGEKKLVWAASRSLLWKMLTVPLGMALSYFALTHPSRWVVAVEFVILLSLARLLFVKRSADSGLTSTERVRSIEEQMKQCC